MRSARFEGLIDPEPNGTILNGIELNAIELYGPKPGHDLLGVTMMAEGRKLRRFAGGSGS